MDDPLVVFCIVFGIFYIMFFSIGGILLYNKLKQKGVIFGIIATIVKTYETTKKDKTFYYVTFKVQSTGEPYDLAVPYDFWLKAVPETKGFLKFERNNFISFEENYDNQNAI